MPLNSNDLHINNMIENYLYLYHTKTLIIIPSHADSVQDSISVSFSESTPINRSAPLYSYSHSGPRTVQVNFKLQRDLMKQMNLENESLNQALARSLEAELSNTAKENYAAEIRAIESNSKLSPAQKQLAMENAMLQARYDADFDYVDFMIKAVQAAALPSYAATEKLVNPPIVALRLGDDIFIKGVIGGNVGITYNYPILKNGKWSSVDISFSIREIEPYSAEQVIAEGSARGRLTLEPIKAGS